MMKTFCNPLLTFITVAIATVMFAGHCTKRLTGVDCFHCPTRSENNYSAECLKVALPPFPICWFHSADYFVAKSLSGALRCCGKDTSDCRCPKKDTPAFMDHIDDWCQGIREHCVPCEEDGNCGGEADSEPSMIVNSMEEKEEGEVLDLSNEDIVDHVPSLASIVQREEEEDQIHRSLSWGNHGEHDGECPTSDLYEAKCLESAIPPYPICTKKSVEEWVEHALKGYDHCCGGGEITALCKCPKRDTPIFTSKIGDWCGGVETCSSPSISNSAGIMGETTASLRASKERLEVPTEGGNN